MAQDKEDNGLSVVLLYAGPMSETCPPFMVEWLRAWDTLAMIKLWRREVVSLIPERGTIVG